MNYKYFAVIFALLVLCSCTKMDHEYAPYLKDGEIIYIGAPYNLEAHSGRGRVELQFTQSKDPNIIKYIIYWNNKNKKLEVPAEKNSTIQKVMVTGLSEQDYTFEIVALDKDGNSSTPASALISGQSLGADYEGQLFTRSVTLTNSKKGMSLAFVSVDTTCKFTVVTYRNIAGQAVQKKISDMAALTDTLADIDPLAASVDLRTAYVPVKGIDTFYAQKTETMSLAAGRYTCTGNMVDVTSAALTGAYPWNVTLRQVGARRLELYDEDYTKDVAHWIKSSGSNSSYGQFGVIFNFDENYNVISVVNKNGQPSGNNRSGELDPSGINKFDPVTKVLKVKYWMNENGTHRTSFDEVMTMK
ncbi:DUF4998 domain-containing protein [Niabella drilacis]|uniref:DUF4959 domain-containing protein n=1 Tax=Niabella drilacis (strain DSM 25811 / CCM 8410 / CCUG 62505 / LMG 26954 / E90) TaxID=1285928 RepID=A0A1G6R646_NIADE|nr:DUF4998 domain-containing protein [Niabella drilacis]SDC99366.1 protein of unknown function [Niabella drilacis]